MFILWDHIADIFYEDCECGLHLLPKITYQTHEINICSSFKFYILSVMFCQIILQPMLLKLQHFVY